MEERNKNLNGLNEYRFSKEWETVRLRVLRGLEKLGHDIPITGYTQGELAKELAKRKREAGVNRRGKTLL